MSEAIPPKWEAHGFRIQFDPTPGGVINEDGNRCFSLKIPALEVTEWVKDREKVAVDIAAALNGEDAKNSELSRLREALQTSRDVHAGIAEYILNTKGPKDFKGMFADLQRARLAADAALNESREGE